VSSSAPADERPIVLFDGVCNLCNGLVQFVIRRDPPPARVRFAALQSNAGQQLLREHGLSTVTSTRSSSSTPVSRTCAPPRL
jgi:predicted DCC family thiol-disulfide oxidoreductase YuxK